MVNQDPVTKTIISESVMEPQALNEINDEEEGTVNSQSEESENELDSSKLSNRNADKFLHQLKEDDSELINKLWTDIQQKIATQSQITTPPGTPSSAPSIRGIKSWLSMLPMLSGESIPGFNLKNLLRL